MKRLLRLLILLTSVVFFLPVMAESQAIDCTDNYPAYQGSIFADIYKSGKKSARQLCKSLLINKTFNPEKDSKALQHALQEYAVKSEQVIISSGLADIPGVKDQVKAMVAGLSNFSSRKKFPEFIADPKIIGSGHEGYFTAIPDGTPRFDIPTTHEKCSNLLPEKNCIDVFNELKSAFNAYRSPYDNFISINNTTLINKLSSDWDRFLDISKSQTAFEVYLTTLFQKSHFKKDHLVGPPKYQVIALHPQFIYESLGDAEGGERLETGIALEWFGINFWDTKTPFGISLARVYVDRQSATPYGNSIMLHFDNQYTIGIADHDGDESVFVTIDLLKLIEDKKTNLQQYLEFNK